MSSPMTYTLGKDTTSNVVRILSAKYDFDAEEAYTFLITEGTVKPRKTTAPKKAAAPKPQHFKPTTILPWLGLKQELWCDAIKLNHGLYTQCTMKKARGSTFCKTCAKNVEDGMAKHGLVDDRIAQGEEWRDPKGRAPIHYGNVIQKMEIDLDTVKTELIKAYNLDEDYTIPSELLEVKQTRRGRPKKTTAEVSDSEDEEKKQKKRGRPRKSVKPVVKTDSDDLIATLVEQAKQGAEERVDETPKTPKKQTDDNTEPPMAPKKQTKKKADLSDEEKEEKKKATAEKRKATMAAKKAAQEAAKKIEEEAAKQQAESELEAEEAEDEDDEEQEEVKVKEFEVDGTTYLKDGEGNLYDPETQDLVGRWNGEEIEEVEEEDDEDDE